MDAKIMAGNPAVSKNMKRAEEGNDEVLHNQAAKVSWRNRPSNAWFL